MISLPSGCEGKGSFSEGVHPPGHKELAKDVPIEVMPSPAGVEIALSQHIGAPCAGCVKPREDIEAGGRLGEASGFISAPVHSPVAGKTARETVTTLPTGQRVQTIPVKTGERQIEGRELWDEIYGGNWSTAGVSEMEPEKIVEKISDAGVVGHGGAAFPTFVKLIRNADKRVDTILVNGCECEPYLTADHRLMVEAPEPIVTGAIIAARAAGAERIVVAIEDNKPEAVESMKVAANGMPVKIAVVKTRYPMGGEKQTVRAVLKRTIPTGGLPLDVGVVVINVATAAAIARAVLRGKPVTHRVISVTGEGVETPKNVLAPIGVSYRELIDFCGGLKPDAARIISGGPMMGFAVGDTEIPVTKGTSGIVVLTEAEIQRSAETACVRCGRCVDVCPLKLVPSKLAISSRNKDWELAAKYYISACMECGCCAYVCPAGIPLVQLIRMGKSYVSRS